MNDERRPKAPSESATTTASVPHAGDIVSLRYGLTAVYIRDTDAPSIARRRIQRNRRLNAEQAQAYQQWLDEQRRDAS